MVGNCVSQTSQRRILQTNCGECGDSIRIDVTDFHPDMLISNLYTCANGHRHTILIKQAQIISITPHPIIESDIDNFIDVPDHIKKLVKEAHKCSAFDTPVAGAGVVRRLLDELLYELGFTQTYLGAKVSQFENRCNNSPSFRQAHETICRRISTFQTIAGLGGYHGHAQSRIVDVVKSEFDVFLHVVEGAIKNHWPNRRSR